MALIPRIPLSIKHAHLPGVDANAVFYRELSDTLEEIARHQLVYAAFLSIFAEAGGTTPSEVREAIRQLLARAETPESEIEILLAETDGLVTSLVGNDE